MSERASESSVQSERASEPDLLVGQVGILGRLTLNRPKAINALTHDMALTMENALLRWADEPTVGAVLISGAGERGLCAGGDIRAIYHDARAGGSATLEFWRDEYRLNALIGSYPKPIVALMHGLVMGGGIGVSAHASHRVVTDGSVLGMPEVGIGLVPDVGGTWLLSRAPGELGTHLALSAARLGPGDAVELGLADWYVPAESLSALAGALGDIPVHESDVVGAVGAAIQDLARPAPWSPIAAGRAWIDQCYAADTIEDVLARLDVAPEPAAATAAEEIRRKSPTALKVTLAALRRARRLHSLAAVLAQEYRVSSRCFAAPDLAEGIRAQVIDKDRDPKWSPPALELVGEDQVRLYFAELGDLELRLPDGQQNGQVAS
jgi:enoyl-CoA hydratase